MQFDGEFRVPGRPDEVLTRFADVPRMAQCMPGASIEGRDDAGLYLGSMVVDFGPKRIRFKGKVAATTDREALGGTLHVRGAADMKAAARAEVRVKYTLRPDPEAREPATIVALSSEAQLGGVLAGFAETGGIVVTRALMDEFAARAAKEFASEGAAPPSGSANAPITPASDPPPALAAGRLLWQFIKTRIVTLFRRNPHNPG